MEIKKYHFIGIGGVGMSALANILLEQKAIVSGSDLISNAITTQLTQKGASVQKGHSKKYVRPDTTVVFNSQIHENNPELQAALTLKCPVLHRSELLAQLMRGYLSFAITGTHGKTTTSSLLTTVLMEGGFDPTFAIGGLIEGINGKLGKGKIFVAEADESDASFLNYYPEGAIITNLEPDHLDYYKTEEALLQAFQIFISHVKDANLLFYCGDDPRLSTVANEKGTSYGFQQHNQLKIQNYRQFQWSAKFDLLFEDQHYQHIHIPLIGEHNALNAAAVFGLSLRLGVSEEQIRNGFQSFPGVSRRCEKKAEIKEILFLDDYAHHPTEITKTLKAVKNAVEERRLIVVFQPHRYTRTRDFLHEFSRAFEMADLLFVTDIYAAAEPSIPGIDSYALVKEIEKNSTIPCHYVPKMHISDRVKNVLEPHDVLLTMGAGDITYLHHDLLKDFTPKKLKLGLIFGGKSCEHEISLRSARFVADSLNRDLYTIHFFGIDKEGKWIDGEEAERTLYAQSVIQSKNSISLLDPKITSALSTCDLFLPIMHGTYGEDGTMQGFFELLNKPYVGPDYRSAAICMDKVLTKRLVALEGIKTPQDISFGHYEWQQNKESILQKIVKDLPFPVYVKPVHLGSSIGITYITQPQELEAAIDFALRYDTKILVEEGKVGCREMEFAVMGNAHGFTVDVPPPGEKLALGQFVNYEKKYGQNTVQTSVTPQMPPEILEKGKLMAKKAYEAIGCTGMTRVDFLLDQQGEFWLFEMNPIPGMQKLSLFPKIWLREGIEPSKLFDRLIVLSLERHRTQKRHYRCLT